VYSFPVDIPQPHSSLAAPPMLARPVGANLRALTSSPASRPCQLELPRGLSSSDVVESLPARRMNSSDPRTSASRNRVLDWRSWPSWRRVTARPSDPYRHATRIAFVKPAALTGIFDGDHPGVALTRPVRSGVRNGSTQRSRVASLYGSGASTIALCGLSLWKTTCGGHTVNHSGWKPDLVAYLAGRLYRFRVACQQPKGRYFLHKFQSASGRYQSVRFAIFLKTGKVGIGC